ncbi:MAG: DUF3040 domain-containing protein [Actinobacteria bacterium]|nr:DUF3040 domain-containing protein [Actinomycetota bacterium]
MPLSEHEERLLAQMEEQLSKDDPRLVSTLTGARTRTPRSTLLSISLLLIGFVTLFGGLISQTIPVGVLGFVIALFGIYRLITSFRQPSMNDGRNGRNGRKIKGAKSSWMSKLEQRWEKRQFGDNNPGY